MALQRGKGIMDKPGSNPTDHYLDQPGNFVSARSSPVLSAQANISGYCLKHEVSFVTRCAWCGPDDVLDLEPDWALTSMDIGGVHLERLIGGVRVSMILPDGDAVSEEFTGPEFYELIYRRMDHREESSWGTVVFLAAVLWVFIAGLAAFFTGV